MEVCVLQAQYIFIHNVLKGLIEVDTVQPDFNFGEENLYQSKHEHLIPLIVFVRSISAQIAVQNVTTINKVSSPRGVTYCPLS